MKKRIQSLSEELFPKMVETRRYLHAHAELSGKEWATAAFIRQKINELGVGEPRTLAEMGVVLALKGRHPEQRMVALRADIDALPIVEQTDQPYQSLQRGVMHACGHDVHTTVALGCIELLNQLRDAWDGTVLFVFQPSEEQIPSGAARMLEAGIFAERVPDAMFGMHVDPSIPVGKIGYRCGSLSASADECYITFHGKGGHGAYPKQFINPILMASQLMLDVQQIHHETIPTVVTFGRMEALGKTNVVPEIATMDGTIRTFDEAWRYEIHRQIRERAEAAARQHGGSVEVKILVGYPVLNNDPALTLRSKERLEAFLGTANVPETPMRMGADDFSYFSEKVPATLLRLGVRNEAKGITSMLHTGTFDVDERAIKVGMEAMSWLIINELNQ